MDRKTEEFHTVDFFRKIRDELRKLRRPRGGVRGGAKRVVYAGQCVNPASAWSVIATPWWMTALRHVCATGT